MKISERLHRAADENLWNGYSDDVIVGKRRFSCHAITYIEGGMAAKRFYCGLGIDPEISCFDEFQEGPIRQGARYLTLKFAALVAESEGL